MVPPKEMYLKVLHETEPVASNLYLDVCEQGFASPDKAALHFGFNPSRTDWRSIDKTLALAVLENLLRTDLAYSQPRLSKHETKISIDEFITHFGPNAQFFTNGEWETRGQYNTETGFSLDNGNYPAFDGGVLVLDESKSGVLWLEDED
jgi:hypothetical protein